MFRSVTLEISLKPFKQTDPEYIRSVCRQIFEQWRPLLKNRANISVMMWTADGSEILDYTGRMDQSFEWCCYLGTANLPDLGDLPDDTSLHERRQLYMENPPVMTYGILKTIVAMLKEEGKRQFPDAEILVGETFDIGPEFAISDFKYHRHPEVCDGTGCDKLGFVDATALLHGDDYPYAAYPDGVPEGTPMGTLLGKQARVFLADMGFDYLWLSNGMGFCYEPWRETGKIYDGAKFYPEKLPDTKKKVFRFWELFREECPDVPLRTRGTNHSVGIDYASDGVPLYDIYRGGFQITPPPNSPWAAINDDFGIEILGHLTRNCELPGDDYMFRYYLHDIWWMNSPWYDRYEGNPHDIYIPMALSRLDAQGQVHTPSMLHILSIDNSMGDMPDACVNEPLPHLLKAEKDAPDAPAPLMLVYPMREYTTTQDEALLPEMFFGDCFLRRAINEGLPLAGVVSTDLFVRHDPELYRQSILLVPAALNNPVAVEKLNAWAQAGGKIIAYGSAQALQQISYSCIKVETGMQTAVLMDALRTFGYSIRFEKEVESAPLPTITVHRNNNASIFSVYSRDTTVATKLKFPLGAPVLMGYNTKIEDGHAVYHFPRSAHAECRVFVKQEGGIVRARELPPVSRKYRRKIWISGLQNAEVCLFAESYCKEQAFVGDLTRIDGRNKPLAGWTVVHDPENGTYLHHPKVTGDICLCMPFPDRM